MICSLILLSTSCTKDSMDQEDPRKEKKFSIEISSGEGGKVNNEGGEYVLGAELTILATPADGYRFKEWSNGQTDNPLTITVSSNLNISAVFEKFSPLSFVDFEGTKQLQIRNAIIKDNSITVLLTYHAEGLGVLKNLNSDTSRDNNAAIINIDLNGNVNWTKLINTDYLYASPHNLIINDIGNFIISGYLAPTDAWTLNQNQEFFIMEMTPNGNQNWIKRIATDDYDTKIQHLPNGLMSYRTNSNQAIRYTAAVWTDAQGGIFGNLNNSSNNPVEPEFLINLNSSGDALNTIKLNNREIDDFRIDVDGVAALKGSNQGKFLVYGRGLKSHTTPMQAVAIAIYDEDFVENERRWIEPFDAFNKSVIIPLDDGGFIQYILLDSNNIFRKMIRKYNDTFELVWEIEDFDEYRFLDFQIDEEYIYVSGFLNYSYIITKKLKLSNGGNVWQFKQNNSKSMTRIYQTLFTEDEAILLGPAEDNSGFFANNPPNTNNEPNLMVIRLNKETGELMK